MPPNRVRNPLVEGVVVGCSRWSRSVKNEGFDRLAAADAALDRVVVLQAEIDALTAGEPRRSTISSTRSTPRTRSLRRRSPIAAGAPSWRARCGCPSARPRTRWARRVRSSSGCRRPSPHSGRGRSPIGTRRPWSTRPRGSPPSTPPPSSVSRWRRHHSDRVAVRPYGARLRERRDPSTMVDGWRRPSRTARSRSIRHRRNGLPDRLSRRRRCRRDRRSAHSGGNRSRNVTATRALSARLRADVLAGALLDRDIDRGPLHGMTPTSSSRCRCRRCSVETSPVCSRVSVPSTRPPHAASPRRRPASTPAHAPGDGSGALPRPHPLPGARWAADVVAHPRRILPIPRVQHRHAPQRHRPHPRLAVRRRHRARQPRPPLRGHHTLKHHGGWKVRQTAPGHLTWTSYLGREYETVPDTG